MDLKKIMPRLKIWAILLGIFLVGFSIRYITHHNLLFDPDSYLWFRLSEYFAGINTKYVGYQNSVLVDQLRYYPTGRNLGSDLPLLPITIGYSFKFFGLLGAGQTPENLMKYMFIIGPAFGGLKACIAYFLIREICNTRVAAFSALFYSLLVASLTRNTAGDAGQESLGGLLIFLWLYLFFKAWKEKARSRSIALTLICGIIFALANIAWGGNIFYFALVSASVLLFLAYAALRNKIEDYKNLLAIYAIAIISGNVLSHIILPLRYPLIVVEPIYLLFYFTAFVSVFMLIAIYISQKIGKIIKPVHAFLGAIFLSAVLLLGKIDILIEMLNGIYTSIASGHTGTTDATVAYYRLSTMDDFKSVFGAPLLLISAFGWLYLLYNFYKKREFQTLFLIIWFILGLIAMRIMIRMSFYLALIIPVLALILADAAFQYNRRKERDAESLLRSSKKAMKEKAQSVKSSVKFSNFLIVAMFIFLLASGLNGSLTHAKNLKGADGQVVFWRDTGIWLKNNTPEEALLISWWDYGYYLQTFAERRTIADGGNAGPQVPSGNSNRNIDVATMFTSTEDKAPEIIELYNLENRPVYVLVSYEEFGKSSAINYHVKDQLYITSFRVKKSGSREQDNRILAEIFARNQISTYSIIDAGNDYLIWTLLQVDEKGNYHPEWSDKLLAKLLPLNTGFGQGLKYFKLVYSNGYVFVYKFEQ